VTEVTELTVAANLGTPGMTRSERELSTTATVPAWRVREGDVSPSGMRVVSVRRDLSRGRVHLGLSNGGVLMLAGERLVQVRVARAPEWSAGS